MKTSLIASLLLASTLAQAASSVFVDPLVGEVMASQKQAQFLIERAIQNYEGMTSKPALTIQWNEMRCLTMPRPEHKPLSGVCTLNVTGDKMSAQVVLIVRRFSMDADVLSIDEE